MKRAICAVPLLAAVFCGSASAGLIGSAADFTVLANTYNSGGDHSIVHGNVIAKTYASTGNGSTINGDYRSGDVLTLGDGATVTGNAQSIEAGTATANTKVYGNLEVGGVGTMGDSSTVNGNFISGLDGTIGANAVLDGSWEVGAGSVAAASASSNKVASDAVDTDTAYLNSVKQAITDDMAEATNDLIDAKAALTAMGTGTALAATMTVDSTFYAGIYSAASWSTTAGTTLTLDAQSQSDAMWVFNISDILAFGGVTTVEVVNDIFDNAEVWWNVGSVASPGGYVSVGAGADINDRTNLVGTIIADTYVDVYAHATVSAASTFGETCGGVYSTTSFVAIHAGAIVGGEGCQSNEIPEPETYTLLLSGLSLMSFGFIKRRRTRKTTKTV
ncbi:PEP-CTERM protein-sorting domain-containing protein [Neptunomonas antarctica]|uniref:PEP-CTERM protein-sorting domain-containing protein n=2 Tax=Neptunomonas antarctica TaxID=619304 RepID=A0A1N7IYQ7_9GAMM|nr:PEP-CTERM protein-sorting domain-containing protein [Neptunomonas antarctica]